MNLWSPVCLIVITLMGMWVVVNLSLFMHVELSICSREDAVLLVVPSEPLSAPSIASIES